MQYTYDFYFYSRPCETPFAVRVKKTVDTENAPFVYLTAEIFSEAIDTPYHAINVLPKKRRFAIGEFAHEIWKEASEKGVRIPDSEYDRLTELIMQVILDPRKRENER